ncbi:glycosyltransferase [Vibrio mediterranei]|uniref:glycosyltransferase n=1 Tax=Vibrio mediterranei TaxID=689 RepID=UPI004067DB26
MNRPNVAVVIVTYNRADMLRDNLNSLKNLVALEQFEKLTYYIVDNNSTDHTKSVVEEFSASLEGSVFYYNTDANLGGAGGFAFGCQKALDSSLNHSHLWLADDDVTFYPDCLKQLAPYIDQKTILQPMRYAIDGSNAEASATEIDLDSIFILNHKRNSVMNTDFAEAVEPFDIQNIPFEGPLIPRTIFDEIGIPDKRYFIFSDDLDFSLKALRSGFEIKCIPSAKMTRLRPAEPNYKPNDWKSYFVYRNFFRIHKEYGKNWFVRHRPYFLSVLVSFYCILTGNVKGVTIIYHALRDGMSARFEVDKQYIP